MATKQVRYIGPYAEGVVVPALDRHVPRGEAIEVEDDLADNLAEQVENWEIVKPPKKGDEKKGGDD
jgi:hypothetical protein